MNKIAIIGGNYGNAGAVKGTEKGSMILKNYIIKNYDVEDAGDLPDYSQSDSKDLGCIEEFKSITEILHDKVYHNLYKDRKVLTIGGDHSIAFGTIWGASEFAKEKGLNFGVIYIDAHGDINNCENSLTKHIHGMPLAYAIGIENYGFENLPIDGILNPNNILYIGTRSLDDYEQLIINDNQIKVISSDEIINTHLGEVFDKVSNFINQNALQAIHLSIDIDVVDPHYAPGTGVPEDKGIHPSILFDLIKYISTKYNIISIDLVEFNPILDIGGKTEYLCYKIYKNILE